MIPIVLKEVSETRENSHCICDEEIALYIIFLLLLHCIPLMIITSVIGGCNINLKKELRKTHFAFSFYVVHSQLLEIHQCYFLYHVLRLLVHIIFYISFVVNKYYNAKK